MNLIKNSGINELLTVVIRSVNERTAVLCKELIEKVIPPENIFSASEIPFSRCVKKSFEIGIDKNKKWTLVLDADVLIKDNFIEELVSFAEQQNDDAFVIQGIVFDKIFHVFRPAGNHLYRTKHLSLAMTLIPEEGTTLRPESSIINAMAGKGFSFIQKDFIAGLHDYEQYYTDIFKKNFLQAHKHNYLGEILLPLWEEKADDPDFQVAIIGFRSGLEYKEKVFIDSRFFDERLHDTIKNSSFPDEKSIIQHTYNNTKIEEIISSAINGKGFYERQEKIFPFDRWNSVTAEDGRKNLDGLNVINIKEKRHGYQFYSHNNSQEMLDIKLNMNAKITFVANGPNQVNGPNIWLQRLLPELIKMGYQPSVIFLMNSPEPCTIFKNLMASGIQCFSILNQNYTELNIIEILKIVKIINPDIFVPNLNVPAYFASRWIKEAGIPTVGIIRSDEIFNHELIEHFIHGLPQYRLSGVECKSEFLKQLVLSKPQNDIKILKCASGTLLPAEAALPPDGELKLVYTGRLIQRQKRIFDVIESFRIVSTQIPGISTSIYGQEREGGRVIDKIKSLNMGNKLKYGGILSPYDIYKTLLKYNVFVLLSDYEGMSTSLMEAMACGLVPICTNIRSGTSEIIEQEVNGLLVNNREDDFLKAVKRLKYEKGLWEQLSKAARNTIEKNYTIEITAKKWSHFIRDLLRISRERKEILIPEKNQINLPHIKPSSTGLSCEDKRLPANNVEIKEMKINQINDNERKAVLAIVCPQVGAVSETFIRKHIELLAPERTVILTGSVLDDSWFEGPIKIIPIELGRYSFNEKQKRDLAEFFAKHSVTHILCEFGCIGGAVVELNHEKLHLPIYVHFHGQDASEFIRRPDIAEYYRWMGSIVDGVVAVSIPMSERLINVGIPKEKIQIIHYGVVYDPDQSESPEAEPCRFISVSRLVGKKGIHFVLQAFEKAIKQIPGITLDIIGDGPLRKEIESFISDHSLTRSIKLHGEQPHSYVLEMMNKSSVFIQHSIVDPETGNAEGLPLSILEASAHGLPVISTFHEGIPEAIQHETTGFLVQEGDWKTMAEYMIRLAKDSTLRKDMGAAGRKRITEEGFTVKSMIDKLRSFIGLKEDHESVDHNIVVEPKINRVLFVNHAIPPYEYSGTPFSTLNHALGIREKGVEVAILIPSDDVRIGYEKEINDKFILYKVPKFDKFLAYFGDAEGSILSGYFSSIMKIINDFHPEIVHINDYVCMPEDIIPLFSRNGIYVIRNVCNPEELCHLDSPVYFDGKEDILCSGPESPEKCAECYLVNVLKRDKKVLNNQELNYISEKIRRRFSNIQSIYKDAVDGIIFTEQAFKEYFSRFVDITNKPVKINPRGFIFNESRSLKHKKIGDGFIHIGFLGSIVPRKGISLILKAFNLIKHMDNFMLDIYGSDASEIYLKAIKELENKYPHKIKFHGKYENSEIPHIAESLDIALVPSIFDTFNRVVRELMYCGVPLIVTDFFGSSIIENNINGIKIKIGDVEALADSIKNILLNPSKIEELSKGVVATRIDTLQDEIDGIYDFYMEVIKSKGIKQKMPDINLTDKRTAEQLKAVIDEGCLEEAEQLLMNGLSDNPDSPHMLHQFGILRHLQGKTAQAADMLEKAMRLNQFDDPEIANDLGAIYYHLGEKEKAEKFFFNALELNHDHIDARKNLADLYVGAGRIHDAIRMYKEILALKANDQEASTALELLTKGEHDQKDHKICPVCGSSASFSITKLNHPYYTCSGCGVVFTPSIDSRVLITNNNGNVGRHDLEADNTRLLRLINNAQIEMNKILDFGCGNGEYGNFLKTKGIQYLGIDQNTDLQLKDIPSESIDGINMVEVIEHLYDPITHFKEFFRILRPGGRIYVESTFHRGQDMANWEYLSPAIGHCLIHSEHSLNLIAKTYKFSLLKYNQHCYLFIKPLKIQHTENIDILHPDIKADQIQNYPSLHNTDISNNLPSNISIAGSVSIIIPVYNKIEYTSQCLEALYKNTPLELIQEVIIIDNASSDGTGDFLKQVQNKLPKLKVITNRENLLFARACNQGGDIALGDYLVFLNNDTEPLPGWMNHAIERFEKDNSIGIVGIKLLYPDMTVQHCGIQFYRDIDATHRIWPLHRYMNVSANDPRVNEPMDMHAVTGACLFIRKNLFRRIGGFEERYGMYFEDTDLCFKARRAGKRVFYEPASTVIHYEGKSSPNQEVIDKLNARSAELFFQLWKQDLYKIELDAFIEKEDGKYVYLSDNFWPDSTPEEISRMYNILLNFPNCYVHFGGSGDALLLMSTFYDSDPEQVIVSVSNSTIMMKSFFDAFPRLKKVYYIPFPWNYVWHYIARSIYKNSNICLGMGATPTSKEDYGEWNADINIFEKYGIQRRPSWAVNFDKARIESMQVTIHPRGSVKGMTGSKRNVIDPKDWSNLLSYLEEKGLKPIIIGTPDEAAEYPCLGNAIDKRSYSFTEQMRLIAGSDYFIGADSWGKTFSALAGIPTFVFHAMRGNDLKNWKDASDYVFLEPWEEITIVKNFRSFKDSFEMALFDKYPGINVGKPGQKYTHSQKGKSKNYQIIRNEGMGDVLMALPVARAIKKNQPDAQITFLTDRRYMDIVSKNPYVDTVIPVNDSKFSSRKNPKKQKGDKIFDLNPARFGTGEKHQIEAFLEEIGLHITDSEKDIAIHIPDSSLNRVNRLLEDITGSCSPVKNKENRKIILLHAAKNDPNRTWPERHWNSLARIILDQGHIVITTGNNSNDPKRGVMDITLPGIFNLVDQLNPPEFTALCRKSDLLITTDSGVVQLAGASDIAISCIYTVIPGRCRLPYRHGKLMWNSVSIEPECKFAGCYHYMQDEKYFGPLNEQLKAGKISPSQLFAEWCPAEKKYACLHEQITPEIVWERSRHLLFNVNTHNEKEESFSQIKELLKCGEEAFGQGELKHAIELFKQVLNQDPQNSQALNNLGVMQWQLGDPISAAKMFQNALSKNPKDKDALENLSQVTSETGRFDLIDPEILNNVIKSQPANPHIETLAKLYYISSNANQ